MRVGHFPYKPGGNPYQMLFADALEAAGIDVDRIPPFKAFPLHQALSRKIDLLQMDWPHDWYSGRNYLARKLKRVMYFHGLRKLRRFPCVWTAHNLITHDADDEGDEKKMIQSLVDCCDGILVMSAAAKEQLEDKYKIRESSVVRIIPHGHYIDAYPNEISRTDARACLGLENSNRVVLSLGRILPYKGTGDLIASFCHIAGDGDVLVVAGPISDESLLKTLNDFADRSCPDGARVIIKPGFVADDHLQYYFGAADVVALPFKHVLNSGSLLLAMSFGRCAVAPRIGSIPEIASPQGYFGYDAENQDGLNNALAEALNSDDLLSNGALSKVYAQEHYSWCDIGQKAKSFYELLLGNQKV